MFVDSVKYCFPKDFQFFLGLWFNRIYLLIFKLLCISWEFLIYCHLTFCFQDPYIPLCWFGNLHSSEDLPVNSRACLLSTSTCQNKCEYITLVLKILLRLPTTPAMKFLFSLVDRALQVATKHPIPLHIAAPPTLCTPTGLRAPPQTTASVECALMLSTPPTPLPHHHHPSGSTGGATTLKSGVYTLTSHLSEAEEWLAYNSLKPMFIISARQVTCSSLRPQGWNLVIVAVKQQSEEHSFLFKNSSIAQ